MSPPLRCFFAFLFPAAAAAAPVDFVRDIQPIFEQHCYACHGPKKQEAAFRLDHKPSALKGGDFGAAIVPGHAADSRLIRAVSGLNPKVKMPRKGEPLTADEITRLSAWIDQGAIWPDSASAKLAANAGHWAFKPVVRPKVPRTAPHPIDAFIRARLAKEGLHPAGEAPPETLIRRLYLDLLGLPPPPRDVEEFVAQCRAKSNKGVPDEVWLAWVNKLLANPHYGELWGRHWLDAARYADSNGYEKDPMRFIWFYRDWVINAFNRDLPYDRFITEQLAGDQLPNATQDQIVATGFLRNSMVNEEGGVDPEQFRMEAMYDRMDAIGKSILGLTINCAQCHNHKYDPITQEDYYRIFAYLNNDNEPWRVVYTPQEQMQRSQVLQRIAGIEAQIKEANPDWETRMAAWENSIPKENSGWKVLQQPFIDDTTGGQKMLPQKDGSFLAQSYAPTRSTPKFEITLDSDGPPITGFRIELLNDPNLPAYGPGRSQKGTCALTEFLVEATAPETGAKPAAVKFSQATADFGEPENTPLVGYARDKESDKDRRVTGPVSYAIDGKDATAWGIDAGPGRRNQPRKAVFVCENPISVRKGTKLTIGLSMKHGGWNSDDLQTLNLGRFRISCTTASSPAADPLPQSVREILRLPRGRRTTAQSAAIFSCFRTTVPEWRQQNDQIELAWKDHPEGTTTLVLDRREEPRMTHLLKRGDFLKPGDKVDAGVPAFLNPLPAGADGSRLTLARWLTDTRAPTTARAFVNRVWQSYFGTGLVATPEDFGTQGEAPSHPELLDWLASEFMQPAGKDAPAWSIKHLQRLIVTSATYRQNSGVSPQLLERDPYNRLLARGPRFRVEGEIVRDIQLSVSGLLNPEMGGRSVMPPAPAYLFERPVSYAPFPWHVEESNEKYRRSIYVFRRRSTPYPFLSTFDVPTGETSCVRRVKSNTPLQALMTLNETLSMEAARALGDRMLKEGGPTPESRVEYGFKLCTARAPTDTERRILADMLRRHQADGAACAMVARVLLNLDETISKE